MKHILVIVLIGFTALSCKNNSNPEVKTVEVASETQEVNTTDPHATYAKAEFTIEGMTCAIGCAATIQKKISKMDGVKSATVDFDKKLAMVEYDEAKVTPMSLTEAVANVSDTYKVSDMKTVNDFTTEKTCKPGCEKACCKKDIQAEEKTACNADCKKACCAKKTA
ncbi:heavy-metal-associated domain-containing protein [Tamlana fucoidanivorans]|nr:heavy metal-associated domain-containing protein [Tamlana fucoidanivorans]